MLSSSQSISRSVKLLGAARRPKRRSTQATDSVSTLGVGAGMAEYLAKHGLVRPRLSVT